MNLKESTLSGEQPNNMYLYQSYAKKLDFTFWSRELLEYIDCFFRNMYKYEYIGVLDIDEVIVPTNGDNWTQMIHNINVKNALNLTLIHLNYIFLNQGK